MRAIIPEAHLSGATAILANGDFPRHPLALGALRSARRIVCCDGAADVLARREPDLMPAAVVGDFDSAGRAARRRYPASVFLHDPDQETNDLTKAFRLCLRRGWGRIVVLGASGRREDHTLGNLALLADYSAEAPGIRLLSDFGIAFAVRADARIRCGAGRAVSLVSFDPDQRLTASGLVWPLEDLRMDALWRGTLNRAAADEFTLHLAIPSPVLVYLAHPSAPQRSRA